MMKYKGYSFINIFGLVIGFSVFILIMLFVQNELNYDKFNKNLDNVYLLRTKKWFVMPAVVGPELESHIPDVQKAVRFLFRSNNHIKYDEKVTKIDNIAFADDTIFDIFTHSFIRGNPAVALKAPFSIVLTESTARKIFGSHDPMNKTLRNFRGQPIMMRRLALSPMKLEKVISW